MCHKTLQHLKRSHLEGEEEMDIYIFFTLVKVPIPSAVMALAARNLNCKSGDTRSSFVLKNPPWSQPVEVKGPDLFKTQSKTTLGLFKVVPGILITEVTDNPSFPFEHS